MMHWQRLFAFAAASALALACGGSGSTGLILPEGLAIEEARRTGGCVEASGTIYCATGSPDAIAPGGQRADAPGLLPNPACGAEPRDCGIAPLATFLVSGFEAGAACTAAARMPGSDGAWATGPLVAVGGAPAQVAFPLPGGADEGSEIALLCFETTPAALAPELARLADAGPDVVFVPATP
jgi:hypothetical protein